MTCAMKPPMTVRAWARATAGGVCSACAWRLTPPAEIRRWALVYCEARRIFELVSADWFADSYTRRIVQPLERLLLQGREWLRVDAKRQGYGYCALGPPVVGGLIWFGREALPDHVDEPWSWLRGWIAEARSRLSTRGQICEDCDHRDLSKFQHTDCQCEICPDCGYVRCVCDVQEDPVALFAAAHAVLCGIWDREFETCSDSAQIPSSAQILASLPRRHEGRSVPGPRVFCPESLLRWGGTIACATIREKQIYVAPSPACRCHDGDVPF